MVERRKKDPEKEESAEKRRRRLGRRSKADPESAAAAQTPPAEEAVAPADEPTPGPAVEEPADTPPKEPVAVKPAPADEPVAAKPAAKRPAAAKAAAATVADEPAQENAAEAKPKRRGVRGRKAQSDKPAEPAAKTKRPAHDYGDNPPMVRAHAKYVRTSARKARLVCDHIRGKSVEEARAILAHANRDVARDWSKLLESAVANAEHNHELIGDDLRIHAVKADEGPTLKRFRPRAMGRATKIRKRTSHLSITLTPMDRNR
jgi:large subunit ribosomal protein L22